MTSIAHTIPGTTLHTRSAGSRVRTWTARLMTAVVVPFLLFDGIIKVMQVRAVTDGMPQLGWPVALAAPLGIILLSCLALYIIPRTAILGAILLTGYLGGAVATHVRVGDPLFSHALFPVYMGALVWGALYLRDARLRALISLRGSNA